MTDLLSIGKSHAQAGSVPKGVSAPLKSETNFPFVPEGWAVGDTFQGNPLKGIQAINDKDGNGRGYTLGDSKGYDLKTGAFSTGSSLFQNGKNLFSKVSDAGFASTIANNLKSGGASGLSFVTQSNALKEDPALGKTFDGLQAFTDKLGATGGQLTDADHKAIEDTYQNLFSVHQNKFHGPVAEQLRAEGRGDFADLISQIGSDKSVDADKVGPKPPVGFTPDASTTALPFSENFKVEENGTLKTTKKLGNLEPNTELNFNEFSFDPKTFGETGEITHSSGQKFVLDEKSKLDLVPFDPTKIETSPAIMIDATSGRPLAKPEDPKNQIQIQKASGEQKPLSAPKEPTTPEFVSPKKGLPV